MCGQWPEIFYNFILQNYQTNFRKWFLKKIFLIVFGMGYTIKIILIVYPDSLFQTIFTYPFIFARNVRILFNIRFLRIYPLNYF